MGYTTEFEGCFDFDKPIDAELVLFMMDIDGQRGKLPGAPDAYCQWVVTKDRLHIKWDGNEKFYKYIEWLQWLIDNKFKPAGITLTGSVKYRGEDLEDVGTLTIVDGRVERVAATFKRVRVHCPNCDEIVDGIVQP